MILKSVQPPLRALDRGDGALLAPGGDVEPIGQVRHLVPVAHPDRLPLPGRFIETPSSLDGNLHPPVLLSDTDLDRSPELLHEELEAVADAEDVDAVGADVVEEAVGEGGRRVVGGMDGVRATGKDDHAGVEGGDGGERRSAGHAEREHRKGADAAGDEVSVLRSVVQDEDEVAAAVGEIEGGHA